MDQAEKDDNTDINDHPVNHEAIFSSYGPWGRKKLVQSVSSLTLSRDGGNLFSSSNLDPCIKKACNMRAQNKGDGSITLAIILSNMFTNIEQGKIRNQSITYVNISDAISFLIENFHDNMSFIVGYMTSKLLWSQEPEQSLKFSLIWNSLLVTSTNVEVASKITALLVK